MSNEVILNLSFDNQTVTDLTGNWILDGTPNATYEQIDGRDGYSIVEGSLGRCIVLNAVDQNARYDEYTVDFDMFVKSTYTSNYYNYIVFYLWSQKNPKIVGSFYGKIGEVLSISPKIGGSSPMGVTSYSPIDRWVHVTITSGPTDEANLYYTAVYVDGVKLIERTESGTAYDGNPFGISQRIIPCARDPGSFLMPNGPGVCLNTYKIVAGIHAPNQKPAISLLNLSRVFNNFCTWLKGKLSTVAFTGSYNDLSNKPTISTVNDGTLTIQQNGTNVQTFTANASTNKTANIQCVDLSTAQTIGGVKTFTSNMVIQGSKKVMCNLDNSFIELDGGTTWGKGGSIVLSGQDRSSYTNSVLIVSKSDSNTDILQYQNGELKPHQNNTNNPSLGTSTNKWANVYATTFNGNVTGEGALTLQSNSGTSRIYIRDNNASNYPSTINLYSKIGDGPEYGVFLNGNMFHPNTNNVMSLGSGNYKWAKVYSDDVVHTTGAETIGGEKTFSNLRTYFGRDISCYSFRKYGKNLNPTSNSYQYLNFGGNLASEGSTNDWSSGYIEQVVDTNGGSRGRWFVQDTSENPVGLELWASGNDKQVRPYQNGNTDLGTSTKKWRDVNTILLNGKTPAYNDDVIPRSGGAVMTGYKLAKTDNTGEFLLSGGTAWDDGGFVSLCGANLTDREYNVRFGAGTKRMDLYPDGTWTWEGQAVQLVSDQRLKQQIAEIDDKLLDAWQDVNLVQFKYNDAVDQKGKDKARLHTGYVVQQIDEACKSHNVDISEYGLYCHEEYAEETREVEQADGTKTTEVVRPASEHYSLRYTEALIVECAYLRKCIKELRTEIEQLKSSK